MKKAHCLVTDDSYYSIPDAGSYPPPPLSSSYQLVFTCFYVKTFLSHAMKQFTIHEPFAHIREDQYVLEIHKGGSEESERGSIIHRDGELFVLTVSPAPL